jgi:hypothetical protein
MITTLVPGVIKKTQIPNVHAHFETIFVVQKRDEEDSAIGNIIKLFKYTLENIFKIIITLTDTQFYMIIGELHKYRQHISVSTLVPLS